MEIVYRALRGSISIFFCILISNIFKLKYPFFVCIPSIMLMTSFKVIKSGENRILGTIIGAIMGTVLIYLGPMNSLASAIGIIIIIFASNFIKWEASASIAGLIFISIMVGVKGDNPLMYSIYRTFDTFIGIVITIIVNELMLYVGILTMIKKRCNYLKNKIFNGTKDIVANHRNINIKDLSKELEKFNDQVDDYRLKKFSSSNYKKKIKEITDILVILNTIFEHLKIISSIDEHKINNKNCIRLNDLLQCKQNYVEFKESLETLVLNYHIEKILDGIYNLNDK
jgi:uncharacterized membrane protein YgaE (UPF0421/DUF939 family)